MHRTLLNTLGGALCALALTLSIHRGHAADRNYFQEDFPFQGACISANGPGENIALKGFAIRVSPDANVLWDTDLLRMAAGWTGGYITGNGVVYNGSHGQHPAIIGVQAFGTKQGPGWANAKGEFVDSRQEPFGPLPKEWCRWDGMYVNGSNVVLAYTVLGSKIFEQPSSVSANGDLAFVRTFRIDKAAADLRAALADVEDGKVSLANGVATIETSTNITQVRLSGAPKNVKLEVRDSNRVLLLVPKGTTKALFDVVIWTGNKEKAAAGESLAKTKPALPDFQKGGPARWPQTVDVKGALNTSETPDGAYTTDSITSPTPNPWNRRVRFGGMDLFSDGKRAALCTHEGDIWVVEGIDDKLENLKWRRFASGQYETLGLAIVDDVIYTSGRDQITRYHDLNKDGEADYYENFNNDIMSTRGFHEFVFDLQTDKDGNFYFAKANPVNGGGRGFGRGGGNGLVCSHAGCAFKVSKDGRKFEIIATGLRAPNGIGVRADGLLTSSDNEGTWMPTTPINWIDQKGQFNGVVNSLTTEERARTWTPPLCWLSHSDYDNSGGGQIWVTSSKWGPFKGELLHESYGKSSLFLVMKEKTANGQMQGGVVRFPLKFTSSVMRARFGEKDGQLYVAGLSEWQSNASKPTGFDRVRYTGKKVYSVRDLKVTKNGVKLTFTEPLASDSVADLQNWSGKRWNYERSDNYGSPELMLTKDANGKARRGRENINITGAQLGSDGKTVTLEIADFQPVMQQMLKWNLKAADGTPISQDIQHTIHAIP